MRYIVGAGSQGDRQGRPYKDTGELPTIPFFVRATLAVALQVVGA